MAVPTARELSIVHPETVTVPDIVDPCDGDSM
jgi:hypothetical protein